MKRKLNHYQTWVGCILFAAISFFICTAAMGMNRPTPMPPDEDALRPDLIAIDAMKVFGPLEKPAVQFRHDLHTDALEKKKKDCLACHKRKDDKLSPMFMRTENTGKQAVMDIFHDNCIGCHNDTAAAGNKSGPVACGECHREKPDFISSRQPMGMDKSLHYRHTKSLENKCELCHHEYNPKTEKLYYDKGQEGSCRYCHKDQTEGNTIAMEQASHASCIACHLEKREMKKEAGPYKCQGCHDLKAQQQIKVIADVPRINRNQPDVVLIRTGEKDLDASVDTRMPYVPFDHKYHETVQDSCRTCHHAAISSCSKCHTLMGSDDGKHINLAQAMHRAEASQSCAGCHQLKQEKESCAGCHQFIAQRRTEDMTACRVCHMQPLPGMAVTPTASDADVSVAQQLLAARNEITDTYKEEDIPEKVMIKKLSDQYEPVAFPHRKIINTLMDEIRDNKLAGVFHANKGTVCQGCHHNSPATKKPTACISCHGSTIDETNVFKPIIKAAYHIECIECHHRMKIEKVGCTDCHKEKKK